MKGTTVSTFGIIPWERKISLFGNVSTKYGALDDGATVSVGRDDRTTRVLSIRIHYWERRVRFKSLRF
jgi:hypothetical protein